MEEQRLELQKRKGKGTRHKRGDVRVCAEEIVNLPIFTDWTRISVM